MALKECIHCDYVFTSKSLLNAAAAAQGVSDESTAIRDMFPFEPDRDEDGSLLISHILARRPRKKGKRWVKNNNLADMSASESKDEYEYLARYKGMSYKHVQWLNASEIEAMSQISRKCLARYLTKIDKGESAGLEDGEIETSFLDVEKILDFREEEVAETVDGINITDPVPVPTTTTSSITASDITSTGATITTANDATVTTEVATDKPSVDVSVNNPEEEKDKEEEKTAAEKFNFVERCRQVLQRIWDDGYAASFQYPVNTDDYPDYLDYIDEPMCLQDVKERLENGVYKKFVDQKLFATDMRTIWSNCKKYNLYKSQIWYSAHSLSLLFERLYQGWVTSFHRVDSITFYDPIGQPWESSCRTCLKENNEDTIILCDHCDAAHHIYCLRPPMQKVPEGAWMCSRCTSWFKTMEKQNKPAKLFSATAEDEARAYVEGAATRQVQRVLKKKYLVKWRGLSYKDCSWETVETINDDDLIASFHAMNDTPPDEPPLTQAEIGIELSKSRKFSQFPAKELPGAVKDLDANVYAQIRAWHFLKYNRVVPDALLSECGRFSHAYTLGNKTEMLLPAYIKTPVDSMYDIAEAYKSQNSDADELPETVVGNVINSLNNDEDDDKPKEKLDKSLKWFNKHVTADPIRNEVSEHLSAMIFSVSRNLRIDPYPARPPLPKKSIPPGEIEVCIQRFPGQRLGLHIADVNDHAVVVGFKSDENGNQSIVEKTGRVRIGDIIIAVDGVYVDTMPYRDVSELLSTRDGPYLYLRFLRHSEAPPENAEVVTDYFENKSYPRDSPRLLTARSLYHGVFPLLNGKWYSEVQNVNGPAVLVGEFDDEKIAALEYDKKARELYGNSAKVNFDLRGNLTPTATILQKAIVQEREVIEYRKDLLSIEDTENDKKMDVDDDKDDEIDIHSYDSRDNDSLVETSDDSVDDSEHDDDWTDNDDDDWKPEKEVIEESDGPLGRLLRAINSSEVQPVKADWSRYILETAMSKSGRIIKRLEQLDAASNQVIRVWDSVNQAARYFNVPPSAINDVLAGKIDNGGGFKWRWLEIRESSPDENEIDDEDAKKDETWKLKLPKKTKDYRNGGTLRDYQVEGLTWLLRCWYTKRSSILADEMGLGKTVQVVTFLEHLWDVENIKGPFMVCVPLSTVEHWRRETEGWTNMTVCVYHDTGGGRDMRDIIREYEWHYKGRSKRLLKFQVLITTYDDLIRDYEELAEVPWRVVVVDEAHRLRQMNSKLAECMRSVCTKGLNAYGYQHRILMTGTPLQNNTSELWSLLNFIEPAKFPDIEKFLQRFGNIQTQEQVEALQRRISPHLLRRVKEDVAKDIPPKEETIIDVELTTMQKQYYRAIYERNHGFLMQSLKGGNMPKLMNIQMELRKCCNHPFLISGVEQSEMENLEKKIIDEVSMFSGSQNRKIETKLFDKKRMEEILIPSSGKMVLIDKLLPKLKREGHKVLIFSQMVKMIDFIEEFCEFRGYKCERLDGRVSGNDRQKSIDRFNRDAESFVFLLSTRAGGVGINLTAADTVIIFDSDWNPQNDVQAMARCHRIGQSKQVTIYRLITRRSFEAEMFERASKKLGLEAAILGSRAFNDSEIEEENKKNEKMDGKEMELLLREGAYAVLLEDDSENIREFCEQDIESLLEQRAHIVVSEGNQKTESWLNKRGKGKTRKSMFTGESAMEHAEIDVNDPDFWKKVLPDLVTPDSMLERLHEGGLEDEDAMEKFMKDLTQMIEGMLDLNRRNQLPERERSICITLLLQITIREEMFSIDDRNLAQQWMSLLEGTRSRRGRQDLYPVEAKPRGRPVAANPVRGVGRGNWRGKKTPTGHKPASRRGSGSGVEDVDENFDDKKKLKRSRPSMMDRVPGKGNRSSDELADEDEEEYKPKPRQRGEGVGPGPAQPIGGAVRKRGSRGKGAVKAKKADDDEEDDEAQPPKKMKSDGDEGEELLNDSDIAALKRKILKGNTMSPDGKADNEMGVDDEDDVDPYSAPSTTYL